jgi:hypothetical protein
MTGKGATLRIMKLAWLLLAAGLLLSACGEPEDQEEFPPKAVIGSDDSEQHDDESYEDTIYAFLAVTVDETAADELTREIEGLAPASQVEFEPGQREFTVVPGASLDCPLWDGPSLRVTSDGDNEELREVLELLDGHDLVLALDAPGLGVFLDGEEPFIECDSRSVTVLLDPSLDVDRDALVESAMTTAGVVAVATDSLEQRGDYFTPDLSGYPEAQECSPPAYEHLAIYLEERDAATAQSIVDQFSDLPGVTGFMGWDIDESLDPVLAWENRMSGEEGEDDYFLACEGLEASVSLDPTISDADAALVASRAAAIPGVADVNLRLIEPGYVEEGCESSGVGGAMLGIGMLASSFIDCSALTSELTIYRGDKSLATQTAMSEALCDLPGVLHISVYDHEGEGEFADPYETCSALHLSVLVDTEAAGNEGRLDSLFVLLEESPLVSFFDGPWIPDYEVYEQKVVFGSVDELLCLNAAESASSMGVNLIRTTRAEAEALAAAIEEVDGVMRVVGNAVGLELWSPDLCGYDGLSLHLVEGGGDDEVAAVLAELEGRGDIRAVVVEEDTPHNAEHGYGSWVQIKFSTETPPADLDELAQRIGDLPGVAESEAWYWAWGEGDH